MVLQVQLTFLIILEVLHLFLSQRARYNQRVAHGTPGRCSSVHRGGKGGCMIGVSWDQIQWGSLAGI